MKPFGLPDGSTIHATALPNWVRVVLNIHPDDGRAFDVYLGEQFIASPRQWSDYPQWLMHENSFLSFCHQWEAWAALTGVCNEVSA